MKAKFVIPIVALVLVCLGVVASFGTKKRTPWDVDSYATAYYSDITGLSKPSANLYRISPHLIPQEKRGKSPEINGYEILEETPLNTEAFSDLLRRLTQRGTYNDERHKCFDPGMGVRFRGENGEEITALICLDCLWVKWVRSGNEHSIPLSRTGALALLEFYEKHFPHPKK